MHASRSLLACLIGMTGVLIPARASSNDWREPTGVCVDGRGCDSNGSNGSDAFSSGPPNIAWGRMTKRAVDGIEACGSRFACVLLRTATWLPMGLMFDAPVFVFKGVVDGGYYGAKGFYYGARGLGKGVAYTGRAIGRGLAYPFNRPPKPILPPTTWEQYKHDVLRHQKMLAKADTANKENQLWCVNHVPLAASPNRSRWEDLCNPGDAISRSALPREIMVASDVPVQAEQIVPASVPAAAAPIVADPSAAAATQTPAAAVALETSLPPPAKPDDGTAVAPLTPAPPEGAPLPTPSPSGDSNAPTQPPDAPQNPEASQQQAVQIGVAPASFVGGETPVPLSRGSAPNFPASFGTPEQVGAALAPDISPANSEAYAYLSRAAGFVAKRGMDRTRDVLTKTAKQAVSTEFGPAVVLINMYGLPETILPKIIKMAKGELSVEEGAMLSIKSVNVLYNFGAAPNKVLAKIIEKRDAIKGIFAYGADEASDKLSLALGNGIAGLTGAMHANARYPQLPQLKGSTAGRVDAIFHQDLKDLTTADVRQKAAYFEDARKEFIQASQALSADENARESHEH